jgi:hypothetical protein
MTSTFAGCDIRRLSAPPLLAFDEADLGLYGYSAWSPRRIASTMHRPMDMALVPGDWILHGTGTWNQRPVTFFASSAVGCLPVFVTTDANGTAIHGVDLIDVVRRSGRPWRWDARTLTSLFVAEHGFGIGTLHEDVVRLPETSVLVIDDGGGMHLWHAPVWQQWVDANDQVGNNGRPAMAALREAITDALDGQPVIPLSAGFDSRVILAQLLALGQRPHCLTLGPDGHPDVETARTITRDLGLGWERIELSVADCTAHMSDAVRCTGGMANLRNLQFFFMLRKARIPAGGRIFCGINGEQSRSWMLGKGNLWGRLANAWRLDNAGSLLRRKFKAGHGAVRHLPALPIPGAPPVGELPQWMRAWHGLRGPLVSSAEHIYSTARVRHFMGPHLAAFNSVAPTASPYLDGRWVKAVLGMQMRNKMGNRHMRHTLMQLDARLAGYSLNGGPPASQSPTLASLFSKSRWRSYHPLSDWLRQADTLAMLYESPGLRRMFPDAFLRKAGNHFRLAAFLAPLHYLDEHARAAGIAMPDWSGAFPGR